MSNDNLLEAMGKKSEGIKGGPGSTRWGEGGNTQNNLNKEDSKPSMIQNKDNMETNYDRYNRLKNADLGVLKNNEKESWRQYQDTVKQKGLAHPDTLAAYNNHIDHDTELHNATQIQKEARTKIPYSHNNR